GATREPDQLQGLRRGSELSGSVACGGAGPGGGRSGGCHPLLDRWWYQQSLERRRFARLPGCARGRARPGQFGRPVRTRPDDRVFGNRLVDMTGGDSAAPDGGVLFGVGATTGYGPADIVYAGDYGNALCASGANVDALPPDASTNPWPTAPGEKPFAGEIVVCDRGIYARVIKGFNVGLAGGGGFVLANSSAEGEDIVRDPHEIPGTHVGFFDGQKLKQWLASGAGHRARIEGETLTENDAYGDVLNQSSSRGLGFWGSFLTPNISAPGTSILAAVPGSGFQYYTGTSMASPHVAGSAALLIGAHPDWTPSQVASALLTTARPSVMVNRDTPATPLEQGSGTVDLAKAVRAGLYFPIERSDFDAANG